MLYNSPKLNKYHCITMPHLDINKIINMIIIKKILQCKITFTYRLQKMNLLSSEETQQLSKSVL
jgi:hypothetical protein